MKAKVLMRFRDKETKKLHEAGEIIDVTTKRVNEIMRKGGYIELIEEAEKPKKA